MALNHELKFFNPVEDFVKIAKYCRHNELPKKEVFSEILFKQWRLERPDFVLSVLGGNEDAFRQKYLLRIRAGVRKVISSTRTIFIFGGGCTGVDEAIASSLKEEQMLEWTGTEASRFYLLGVNKWDHVFHHQEIADYERKSDDIYEYVVDHKITSEDSDSVRLNYLCSHFFFDQDAKIRAALEIALATHAISSSEPHRRGIPSVTLLIGGKPEDINIITHIKKTLTAGIPLVIARGSGGLAALLLRLIKRTRYLNLNMPREELENPTWQKPAVKIFTKAGVAEDQQEHLLSEFWDLLKYASFISIYALDRSDDTLDGAVLKALYQAAARSGVDSLSVAITWNRCDRVVRRNILNGTDINDRANISDICLQALTSGSLEFVQLFLEAGFEIRRFLTPNNLAALYADALENFPPFRRIMQPMQKHKRCYTIHNVYEVIYKFTLALPKYELVDFPDTNLKVLKDPYRELVFWAVFSNKPELAKFFLSRTEAPLMTLLIISRLWSALLELVPEEECELREELEPVIEEYRVMARRTLNEYTKTNKHFTRSILILGNESYNHACCLDIAGFIDDKEFLVAESSQVALEYIWTNGMRASMMDVLKCICFPFLITSLESEKMSSESPAVEVVEKENESSYVPPPTTNNRHLSIIEEEPVNEKMIFLNCNNEKQNNIYDHEEEKKDPEKKITSSVESLESVISGNQPQTFVVTATTISQFYNAPVTKFFLSLLVYVGFLIILSYFYMFSFPKSNFPTEMQWLLFFLMVTYFIEMLWHLHVGELHWSLQLITFLQNEWHILEIIFILLSFIGIGATPFNSYGKLIARTCYGIVCIFAWCRLLRYYLASAKLGPMWIMIRRMLKETLIFSTYLLVFMMASGITIVVLNYDPKYEDRYREELLKYNETDRPSPRVYEMYHTTQWMFLRSFFTINGSLFLNVLTVGLHPALCYVLTIVFLMMGNSLMLNLLIAIYASIFNEVQENSTTEWAMEKYWVVQEFQEKTILPPPFNIFEIGTYILKFCILKRGKKAGAKMRGSFGSLNLTKFESYCFSKALKDIEAEMTNIEAVSDIIVRTEKRINSVLDCTQLLKRCHTYAKKFSPENLINENQ